MLLRAGLIDAPRYLKLLAATVNGVLAAPGGSQSLAEASYEAWIKYYRPDENSPNATVSYYAKGRWWPCAWTWPCASRPRPRWPDAPALGRDERWPGQ